MNIEKIVLEINEFSKKIKDVSITVQAKNNILITKLSGTIDTYNSSPLGDILLKALDLEFSVFVYDLKDVTYISSTGMGVFTHLLKESKSKNKKIFISNLQPKVKEVYELLGFSSFFNIINDLSEINIKKECIFPVSFTCHSCSASLKVPRSGRFSCKTCKHIFIINDEGKIEEEDK